MVDTNEARLRTATRFGAIPLNATKTNAEERKAQVIDLCPHGVDVVVEMAGVLGVVEEGIGLLRNGGHYSFVGLVHPNSVLSNISGEQIIRKCLTIRGVHNYSPWHLSEAMEFLEKNSEKLPWDALFNPKEFALKDIDNAFTEAMKGDYCRVVLDCQR